MTQEALKLALEALKKCHYYMINAGLPNQSLLNEVFTAATAIKEALAKEKALQALHNENERLGLYKDAYAQPEQEPNIQASIRRTSMGGLVGQVLWIDDKLAEGDYNLHATPPQRKPLTHEQREEIAKGWRGRNWTVGDIIDATEAAHGIKD